MPKRDGTGPDGKGPGTGRRLGPCRVRKSPITNRPIKLQRRLGRRGYN